MYSETDKYLIALFKHQSHEDACKVFSSYDMQESVLGIHKNDGLIDYMPGRYLITQFGKAEINKGGLHKMYLRKKRLRVATYIAAISGIIAAVASIFTLIIK